jgi:hypothetical protein
VLVAGKKRRKPTIKSSAISAGHKGRGMEERMRHDDPRTWKVARGKGELIKHLDGKQLTASQGIKAKCYECTVAFDAGKDCMIPDCPLYQFLPTGKWGERKKKKVSPETRAKMAEHHRRRKLLLSLSDDTMVKA